MVKRSEHWHLRSPISRLAHVVERSGLALTGGSCGLFVAAHISRSDFNPLSSYVAILAMMICGAAGFYLGIDLPPRPEKLGELSLRKLGSKADAVELLSAGGTFLTAVVAVIAVASIIADEVTHYRGAVSILLAWAIGASMQIIAGIIARLRAEIAE